MTDTTSNSQLPLVLAHRRMMWSCVASCVISYGSLVVAGIVTREPGVSDDLANMIVIPIIAAASLLVAVFTFQAASGVYGVFPGLVCAVLVFVPCTGIIAILILNNEVAEFLKKNGIPVGFMGATKQQIQEMQSSVPASR